MSLGLGLGLGLTRNNDADTALVRALLARSYLYGRDGSETCTRATQKTCPFTGNLLANNIPCKGFISSASGILLPAVYVGSQFQNLFLNDSAPVTQNITVSTGTYTIRPRAGSGYTVTTSAGTATGTGFGAVAIGSSQTMTITVGGTVVVTIAGSPVGAKITFVAGPIPGPYIPTAGSAVTHNTELVSWTPPGTPTNAEITLLEAPYLWETAANTAPPHVSAHRHFEPTIGSFGPSRSSTDTWDTVSVAAPLVSNGKIRHVSFIYTGANVSIYQNGVLVSGPTANTKVPSGDFRIGQAPALNRGFDGTISLFLTQGGLTQAERSAIARLFANRQITWAV